MLADRPSLAKTMPPKRSGSVSSMRSSDSKTSKNRSVQRKQKAAEALSTKQPPQPEEYLEKIHESLGTQLSKARKGRQTRGKPTPATAEVNKSKSNINLEQLEYIKQISEHLTQKLEAESEKFSSKHPSPGKDDTMNSYNLRDGLGSKAKSAKKRAQTLKKGKNQDDAASVKDHTFIAEPAEVSKIKSASPKAKEGTAQKRVKPKGSPKQRNFIKHMDVESQEAKKRSQLSQLNKDLPPAPQPPEMADYSALQISEIHPREFDASAIIDSGMVEHSTPERIAGLLT